jgi:hypothetical protein
MTEGENKQWIEIREKLIEDIEITLNSAVHQSSHNRKQTLTSLFQDLINRVKKKIQSKIQTLLSTTEVLKDDKIDFYYQIFADFYEKNLERVFEN